MRVLWLKRGVDIVGSSLLLFILSPLMLVLALLVWRKMGRPILFRQVRPGLHGKPFVMYKFRTMTDACDARGNLLPDSERLTPFGKWLRATSLDELPELFNVLKGDMSLVGPRPLLMEYLDRYTPEQARRHEVKPGITGWAQIHGRNALSWEEKFKLDVWYVDHWSLWLDFKILWRTLWIVLKREGISADGHATMPEFSRNQPMMQSKPVVNVLFTASGRRVELIRAFRKAYVEAGIRGKIVCVDMSPLAPTLYEADAAYIMPPSEHPDYAAILAEVCAREEVHLVFPLIDGDVETLARHRTVVESSGARLIVVSDRAAEIVSDKWLTYQFFRQLEIPTPLSWLPDQLPAGSYHYPLFVKPRRGSSSKYTYKVSDEAELLCYLRRVPEPIIQQHLDGIEITTDVFCDFEGKVLGAVSRQRLETRAGEVSKGKTVFLPEVLECCLKIASALQLIGPANIQCFIVDNSFLFTEVNARFGGGAPLSFAAGANAPLWYLQLAAGLPVACPPIEAYTYGLYMTRYDETRFLCEAEYEQMASRRFRLG